MSAADYIIIGAVVLALAAAVWFWLRQRRAGKGCAGGCAGCPHSAGCGSAAGKKPGARRSKRAKTRP